MQRTLAYARFLSEHGWEPIVLSVHPRTYLKTGDDLLGLIPDNLKVYHAPAWDTAQHLAWNGRYLNWMALPDRWISWLPGGVFAGLNLIRKYHPKAIWSTYPIATAHLIAWALKSITGTPWIADFRDPMVEIDPRTKEIYPPSKTLRNARLFVERKCAVNADRLVFCTNGAKQICSERYPSAPIEKYKIIPNGYNEESFQIAEKLVAQRALTEQPITLLHSGILYNTSDRDPSHFFKALKKLKDEGILVCGKIRFILRATRHDDQYRPFLERLDIADLVTLAPPISYHEALAEMLTADGLLLFQGYTSNAAIPAKLYEYLRAGKPILAMADSKGDTAALLRELNTGYIFPLDDSARIAAGLVRFLSDLTKSQLVLPPHSVTSQFDRRNGTALLSNILKEL